MLSCGEREGLTPEDAISANFKLGESHVRGCWDGLTLFPRLYMISQLTLLTDATGGGVGTGPVT